MTVEQELSALCQMLTIDLEFVGRGVRLQSKRPIRGMPDKYSDSGYVRYFPSPATALAALRSWKPK